MGRFVVSRQANREYKFVLEASNNETILVSEGYITKQSCLSGIESVRTNASNDLRYERKISINNKYYFTLKSGNGEIIGTSEMYETKAGRDNGIESVKANAPTAIIYDRT